MKTSLFFAGYRRGSKPGKPPPLARAVRDQSRFEDGRIKIFRQISERFLTEWGNRHEMFEKFNGTPLYLINLLTMQQEISSAVSSRLS